MLQLACWNIHGFHVDKINEVLANNNYDIFGIVESWASGKRQLEKLFLYFSLFQNKGRGY
jgi:hypothetical protein